MDNIISLTPIQQMAAFSILHIEDNAPTCSECNYGVLRPNCAIDMDSCPRHEISDKIYDMIHKIEKKADLPPMWQQKAPLYQLLEKPTEDDMNMLKYLVDNDEKFEGPKRVNWFDSFNLKHCGYWSVQSHWKFTLSKRGKEYYEYWSTIT